MKHLYISISRKVITSLEEKQHWIALLIACAEIQHIFIIRTCITKMLSLQEVNDTHLVYKWIFEAQNG